MLAEFGLPLFRLMVICTVFFGLVVNFFAASVLVRMSNLAFHMYLSMAFHVVLCFGTVLPPHNFVSGS